LAYGFGRPPQGPNERNATETDWKIAAYQEKSISCNHDTGIGSKTGEQQAGNVKNATRKKDRLKC
jgi:hypothetical protein